MAITVFQTKSTQWNKTKQLNRLFDFLDQDVHHRVLYFVLDSTKFEVEQAVHKQLKKRQTKSSASAMMRFDVTSFTRFYWKLRQDYPFVLEPKTTLSKVGQVMAVKKLFEDYPDEALKRYIKEKKILGFQEQLVDVFSEWKNKQIEISDLNVEAIKKIQAHEETKNKLLELSTLYQAYDHLLEEKNLRSSYTSQELKTLVQQEDFSHTWVVIEGYDRFSSTEWEALKVFFKMSPQVWINLILPSERQIDEGLLGLYEETQKITLKQIQEETLEEKIELVIRSLDEQEAISDGLKKVRAYLEEESLNTTRFNISIEEKEKVGKDVSIWEMASIFSEAEQVSNSILTLVQDHHYRYQDIQIIVSDNETYRQALFPYLDRNHIPYFDNQTQKMTAHPLARFMDSLSRIFSHYFQHQDVFNLLKTELLTLDMETDCFRFELDEVENFVLKHGIQGLSRWEKSWHEAIKPLKGKDEEQQLQQQKIKEERLNAFRSAFIDKITPLYEKFRSKELTTKEALSFFYHFLLDNQVPQTLMTWAKEQAQKGYIEEGQHHEQAWQTFVEMMEDYQALFSEDIFDMDRFFEIIQSGFEASSYKIVPPTLDAVRVSDYDTRQAQPRKISYVLGLTNKALPKQIKDPALFGDEERALLSELTSQPLRQLELLGSKTVVGQQNQKMVAYRLFTSATEHLILTSSQDEEGKKERSPFIQNLMDTFQLEVLKLNENGQRFVLGNEENQLHHFIQEKQRTSLLNRDWKEIEAKLKRSQKPYILKLLSQLQEEENRLPQYLSPQIAQNLYAVEGRLQVSVSNMEVYNQDPFSFFLRYGLRLKERELFEVNSRLTGSLYHEVLKAYYDNPQKNFDETFDEVVMNPDYEILNTYSSYQYRRDRMKADMASFVSALTNREKEAGFYNAFRERYFRYDGKTARYPYRLIGSIDRIDQWKKTGELSLFDIVDYKSSDKRFDWKKVKAGTQLQLLTYLTYFWKELDSQVKDKLVLPMGAFYEHVTTPLLKLPSQKKLKREDYDEEKRNSLRYQGIALKDTEVLFKEQKQALPAFEKEIFKLSKASKISKEEFKRLGNFIENKIEETVDHILDGEIPLSPIKEENGRNFDPSLNEYLPISTFDATNPIFRYRHLDKIDLKEFLNEQKEQEDEDEDETRKF